MDLCRFFFPYPKKTAHNITYVIHNGSLGVSATGGEDSGFETKDNAPALFFKFLFEKKK